MRPSWRWKKKVVDRAPRKLRPPEPRRQRVRLLGGLMVWISTPYCGPRRRTGRRRGRKGSGLYPELAVLGIREGATPALLAEVARQAAVAPSFALAQHELAHRGVPLDIKVVHRLAQRLGAELLTVRQRELERYRAGQIPVGTALAGKRVGVALDGGRIRIRTEIRKQKGRGRRKKQRRKLRVEWREPKVVIVFEMDQRGRLARDSRPWIDGTFAGPDEIMELLALHLHRLGAVAAKQVVFLADGAPWIWERLPWVQRRVGLAARRVVQVLDWCHAAHHISLALAALGMPEPKRRRLYAKLRRWLRAGQADQVVKELLGYAVDLPEAHAVWTEITYLETHELEGRLDYPRCRRRRVPLGSGAIESTIRRLINLRLKGNGLLWKEANAEGMLLIRATWLTGRWHEQLAQVQESIAADRHLSGTWQAPDMRAQLNADQPIAPPTPHVPTDPDAPADAA